MSGGACLSDHSECTRNAGFLNMIGNEEIVKLILDDFEYRSKLEVDQLLTRWEVFV